MAYTHGVYIQENEMQVMASVKEERQNGSESREHTRWNCRYYIGMGTKVPTENTERKSGRYFENFATTKESK